MRVNHGDDAGHSGPAAVDCGVLPRVLPMVCPHKTLSPNPLSQTLTVLSIVLRLCYCRNCRQNRSHPCFHSKNGEQHYLQTRPVVSGAVPLPATYSFAFLRQQNGYFSSDPTDSVQEKLDPKRMSALGDDHLPHWRPLVSCHQNPCFDCNSFSWQRARLVDAEGWQDRLELFGSKCSRRNWERWPEEWDPKANSNARSVPGPLHPRRPPYQDKRTWVFALHELEEHTRPCCTG
jgi:hypothetical protein